MSNDFLATFSRKAADVVPVIGTENFATRLAELFKAVVPTNNVMVILYPSKKLPLIEYNDLPPENRRSIADQYVNGAFLLDPFYIAARKGGLNGFFHLCDIVPEHFEKCEYNSSYFKYSGLSDECGYLVQFGEGKEEFVIVSLGQIDTRRQFSQDDLDNLTATSPLVESLVKHHWDSSSDESENHFDMRKRLETALDSFGTSFLTDRENQTVQMILHGYANKAIAEKLNISIETVKLHRKNAYAKLDLGTQGELFNLFINSLMNVENYSGGDPLTAYFGYAKAAGQAEIE